MRNLIKPLALLFCITLAIDAHSQKQDDSRYLAGAVPEVDGKVVFSKEFSIPGMTQQDIFSRTLKWMESRLAKNANNSRVLYINEEEGQLVGTGEEWLVFTSKALSLDRTLVTYQLTALCQDEKCELSVEKIRYTYRGGEEKYIAEEWIADKYALNKDKTKLVRGIAKWRRKTVDFVDELYLGLADVLRYGITAKTVMDAEDNEESNIVRKTGQLSGPMVIVPMSDMQNVQEAEQTSMDTSSDSGKQYMEVEADELDAGLIQADKGKLVISIGNDPFNMTMMTADAGGSLGEIEGKRVIFIMLSPDQPYGQIDSAEEYIVSFYPDGSNQPSVILTCRKHAAPAAAEGMPHTYAGEILKAEILK